MADNREPSEAPNNPVKIDQVRNMPGGALLRTIPGSQGRFMMATPVQSSAAAIISSTTTIQTQVVPKVTGQGTPTGVSRISTVPIQAPSTTAHFNHVPRGAAAVANISVPRSSVATPIVRGPATLQTIGVAQQHNLATGGRPVVGVACLPAQQRPPPIPVGAKLVSSQMRPLGDATRPVLLHAATHKQVTLTQQQVQSTLQMSGAVKSYSNATRHPSTPSLSRITTAIPGMVQLPAVFLPSQPIKPQPQPKVITQPHGAAGVQIPSATSSVPQTLSISTVVSRPGDVVTVVLSGGTVANTVVRPATVKPAGTLSTEPTQQQLYIPGGRSTILVREAPRTKESEPMSISVSSTHTTATSSIAPTAVNTIYTLPGAAASYFEGGTVRPITLASRTPQGVPTTSAPQPMRLNSVMVVEQPPQPPRIHTIVPTTSSQENSHIPTVSIPVSENSCITSSNSIAGIPLSLAKQITSPRPSILRKRDPEGSPMKGAKNLTPLLTGLGRGASPPPGLPPSPPGKRPESSSGGSTTVSANSSPGESPPAQPLVPKEEEEPPAPHPPTPVPQLRVLPPTEVSPRKKPRKQQLTGNQMSEPTFSEDEMEFISEEKMAKEKKEEPKIIPKRKTMTLLSTYKNLWKPRNNHFMRYTDVKPREDKVPSLSELANQKHALQKIHGWKMYHLGSQIEDVVSSEEEFIDFYNSLLTVLEINQKKSNNKDFDKEYSRINERVRANFQRTVVAKDQMLDAKSQIMKFEDHKNYVADLINKNISKRSSNKKRDRL